ncbi:phosphotransferase [Actinoplanes sp. LDG1-06]|uniref:Phosphotransferase n=1 Tax=Paractinoplanes ovalisporus TaxID=2810368 RepID=A0ABS2A9K1_9ACTN|nr:phosphotransferase [Actinoplanes ovalisporus]MBM2615936.1 phosphotransferase [Actinoplanes ovalisporus]
MDRSLAHWAETAALPGRRITATRTLTGGYSNDNTLLTTDDGSRYVLRRYLKANKCALEEAIARRVATVVPVPEVIASDPTGESAGEPVLLSAFVPGRPVGEILAETDDPALGRDVGATLARIGSIEFDAPGFFAAAALTPGGALEPDGFEPVDGLDLFVDRCLREGNAAGHLTGAEQDALRRYASDVAPELAALKGSRRLVHSDFNPKNLLATEHEGGHRLSAVLDWEYAFSSSPLVDIGNMLRDPRPPAYLDGFLAGFRDAGGDLPPNWRRLSQGLDLFALADFLTRPPAHRYFQRSVTRIRDLLGA